MTRSIKGIEDFPDLHQTFCLYAQQNPEYADEMSNRARLRFNQIIRPLRNSEKHNSEMIASCINLRIRAIYGQLISSQSWQSSLQNTHRLSVAANRHDFLISERTSVKTAQEFLTPETERMIEPDQLIIDPVLINYDLCSSLGLEINEIASKDMVTQMSRKIDLISQVRSRLTSMEVLGLITEEQPVLPGISDFRILRSHSTLKNSKFIYAHGDFAGSKTPDIVSLTLAQVENKVHQIEVVILERLKELQNWIKLLNETNYFEPLDARTNGIRLSNLAKVHRSKIESMKFVGVVDQNLFRKIDKLVKYFADLLTKLTENTAAPKFLSTKNELELHLLKVELFLQEILVDLKWDQRKLKHYLLNQTNTVKTA